MKRNIIKIDQDKCVGCGLCVKACHQSAIGLVDGKATLLREDYCDGLGRCLPNCPVNALSIVETDSPAAVQKTPPAGGCPGSNAKLLHIAKEAPPTAGVCPGSNARALPTAATPIQQHTVEAPASQLRQWPVQIKLVPANAPYFNGANLLIAADCCAYSYAGFHDKFMKNKITIIGCPKLDEGDYSEKLAQIIEANDLKSITVVRMEVPCCGGIVEALKAALVKSGKILPWQIVTLSTDGQILED